MIITQTPLRISLLGGGTDFPDYYLQKGGAVLTTAIDKYVYCIVKKRFDDDIYVNYSQKEIVKEVSEIKHDLVREAMGKTGVRKGVEISFLSDIPAAGSGLGSSSSVTVGTLNALYLYRGLSVGAERLAQEACEIEIDILKRPQGVQDQYIAAYGGVNFMEFTIDGVRVQNLGLSPSELQDLASYLMVFYTGATRKSKTVLKEQKDKARVNEKILSEMTTLAIKGRDAAREGNYELLGKLVDESWEIKKKFASKVSNPGIDKMYNLAKKAGAYGGKISGAGAGGFMTLVVSPDKKKLVRKALSNYNQMPIGFSVDGSKAIFNIRR